MSGPKKVKAEAFIRKTMGDGPYNVVSTPLWALPRTIEAYEQMIEQAARGIANCWDGSVPDAVWTKEARAALRAIGITQPK